MTKLENKVCRQTLGALDGSFCADRGRLLIVCLEQGDLISLRPKGRRTGETVSLFDVYRFAVRCAVGRKTLEKARERKAKKALRLAAQRQLRAEKRLVERE